MKIPPNTGCPVLGVHIKSGVRFILQFLVYPTTMTQSMEDIYLALDTVRQAMAEPMADGARILGVHLEGPFVNRERRGAQPLEFIRKPDFSPKMR